MTRMIAPTIPNAARPDKEMIPRALMRGMLALVLASLAMVTAARLSGRPVEATPPAAPIEASRTIFLSGDMAGAARVLDARGNLVADLGPQQGGFISGVWRVILRERTKARAPLHGPVTLLMRQGGRMEIHDPSTGWGADLMGFGHDNAMAFAKLLKAD